MKLTLHSAPAQLHTNNKDFTWSTRQSIGMRLLIPALHDAGIRAESDTSFGDSVMVVISPTGSDRQIKGQVLADGTIRLAGCRGDGPEAGRAVVGSLNDTGCLQGGKVDLSSLRIEVWLTKRHFDVCGVDSVVNIDALHAMLAAKNFASDHPTLVSWASRYAEKGYKCIQSVNKVGSVSPRLEIKFQPVVIPDWELVTRKPEPVSLSVHHKGEVQLAGNAEYKVLQGFWFIKQLVERHSQLLISSSPVSSSSAASVAKAGTSTNSSSRGPKRKLEVAVPSEPPSTPGACNVPLQTPPTRRAPRTSTPRASRPSPMPRLSSVVSSSTPPTPSSSSVSDQASDGEAAQAGTAALPPFFGQPMDLAQLTPAGPEAGVYHMQQMFYLSIMRQHCALVDAMRYAQAAGQMTQHGKEGEDVDAAAATGPAARESDSASENNSEDMMVEVVKVKEGEASAVVADKHHGSPRHESVASRHLTSTDDAHRAPARHADVVDHVEVMADGEISSSSSLPSSSGETGNRPVAVEATAAHPARSSAVEQTPQRARGDIMSPVPCAMACPVDKLSIAMDEEATSGCCSPIETPPVAAAMGDATIDGVSIYNGCDDDGASSPMASCYLGKGGGRDTPMSPYKDASRARAERRAAALPPKMGGFAQVIPDASFELEEPMCKKQRVSHVPLPPAQDVSSTDLA